MDACRKEVCGRGARRAAAARSSGAEGVLRRALVCAPPLLLLLLLLLLRAAAGIDRGKMLVRQLLTRRAGLQLREQPLRLFQRRAVTALVNCGAAPPRRLHLRAKVLLLGLDDGGLLYLRAVIIVLLQLRPHVINLHRV